jgi:tetratricopeptide (TPR) repeat protein
MLRSAFGVAFSCVLACCVGCAPTKPQGASAAPMARPAHLEISCTQAAQAQFDDALTLLHHMTYPQARAAFAAISRQEPQCAMAHWGVAMTLFQPLWPTRPTRADLELGATTLRAGLALGTASARERAWLEALAAFFRDPASPDYWVRIDAWESAMASLHAAYPDESEAAAFYALALLASARPGQAQQEHSQRAIALLAPLLRAHPGHPGAMHYMVHADDIPGRESSDLDVVRKYETVAPDNPHALHMPTHIYVRLGDWDAVVRGNLRAADAALRYPAGERGEWVWDEYAHAIEYLVYAYLQQGADAAARAQIERLFAVPHIEPSAKTAFHLASTRARFALERHAWREAAAIEPRQPETIAWDRFAWPEAIAVYARGYGAARTADSGDAQGRLARLKELETKASAGGEVVFAHQIAILRLELAAAIAHAAKDDGAAIAQLREAVALETATPKPAVTPAATIPAAEQLGELLLENGNAAESADAFRQALQAFPRRFNATLGLARAQRAAGDEDGARRSYCELLGIASGERVRELEDVRAFAADAAAKYCRKGAAP